MQLDDTACGIETYILNHLNHNSKLLQLDDTACGIETNSRYRNVNDGISFHMLQLDDTACGIETTPHASNTLPNPTAKLQLDDTACGIET